MAPVSGRRPLPERSAVSGAHLEFLVEHVEGAAQEFLRVLLPEAPVLRVQLQRVAQQVMRRRCSHALSPHLHPPVA